MSTRNTPIWIKVTAELAVEPEEWSVWAEVFERHGLPGTVQTDEPPTISAYLPPGSESAFEPLRDELVSRGASNVSREEVAEEDWAESWKQFFKPVRIGKRFVVRPTWEEFELGPDDLEIVLDPGQAFGTGDHPTTRMCLELVESQFNVVTPGSTTVADIGCGSGILSIAAAKLGAKSVDSVDTDGPSVEATNENAERNGVEITAHLGRGFDPFPLHAEFGLIVSNIISAALISLAPEAARRTQSGGVWIVSGIIESNWDDVKAAAEKAGFELVEKRQEGEWVAAVFRR